MKILHTADWHLGARLVDHDRSAEHQLWLDHLLTLIQSHAIDLLVVAGDVFDSANPPQSALAQYYGFLTQLSTTGCAALIVGGNHDSPATLDAPRGLLQALRITVQGAAVSDPAAAVIAYPDAVLCAVPFLRERDVRSAQAGQTHEEVVSAMREGIRSYYQNVLAAAQAIAGERPIIATGHLTAIGVTSASSERQIHIGNLAAVGADCFAGFAYTALGHIHRPQNVGGRETIRYSGSPIFLAFDEAATAKQVLVIDPQPGSAVNIQVLPLPVFRPLLTLSCAAENILSTLVKAVAETPVAPLPAWVELTITDPLPPADLEVAVRAAATVAGVQVLKIVRPTAPALPNSSILAGRVLSETTPTEILAEKLRMDGIAADSAEHQEILQTFTLLLNRMEEAAG